jgi:hypothetical protein
VWLSYDKLQNGFPLSREGQKRFAAVLSAAYIIVELV